MCWSGDIYSVGQNRGRGGWSWYTGAAAWLYRCGLEALLGLKRQGDRMSIDPMLAARVGRDSAACFAKLAVKKKASTRLRYPKKKAPLNRQEARSISAWTASARIQIFFFFRR